MQSVRRDYQGIRGGQLSNPPKDRPFSGDDSKGEVIFNRLQVDRAINLTMSQIDLISEAKRS